MLVKFYLAFEDFFLFLANFSRLTAVKLQRWLSDSLSPQFLVCGNSVIDRKTILKLQGRTSEREYRQIPITSIISPGFIFVKKAVLVGLFSGETIFRGAYYWKAFCVSKWVGLYNNNSLKPLKTARTNGPWAYILEGLLPRGPLRLRFGGFIFGRPYFILFFFLLFFLRGGGGGVLSEVSGIR